MTDGITRRSSHVGPSSGSSADGINRRNHQRPTASPGNQPASRLGKPHETQATPTTPPTNSGKLSTPPPSNPGVYKGDPAIAYRAAQISALLHNKNGELDKYKAAGQNLADISPTRQKLSEYLAGFIQSGEGTLDRAAFFTELGRSPAKEEAEYQHLYQPAKPAEAPSNGSSEPATPASGKPSGTDKPAGRSRPANPQPSSPGGNTPATDKPNGGRGSRRPEDSTTQSNPSEPGTGGRTRSMKLKTPSQEPLFSLDQSAKLPKFDTSGNNFRIADDQGSTT